MHWVIKLLSIGYDKSGVGGYCVLLSEGCRMSLLFSVRSSDVL